MTSEARAPIAKPPVVDPSSLEIGNDTDLGSGDEGFGPTPVALHGALHVTGTELRDESRSPLSAQGREQHVAELGE